MYLLVLASLTFPHILLEYLIEKNETQKLKSSVRHQRGFCAGVDRAIEIVKKTLINMEASFMSDMKLYITKMLWKTLKI